MGATMEDRRKTKMIIVSQSAGIDKDDEGRT